MSDPAAESRRRFLRYLAASPIAASLASYMPALAQQRLSPEVLKAADALNVFELEAIAKRNIPLAHFGYLSGGVLDDRTVQSNRQAFDAWGLRARRLIDVSKVYQRGLVRVPVLMELDLEVPPGEFLALMGPSGS